MSELESKNSVEDFPRPVTESNSLWDELKSNIFNSKTARMTAVIALALALNSHPSESNDNPLPAALFVPTTPEIDGPNPSSSNIVIASSLPDYSQVTPTVSRRVDVFIVSPANPHGPSPDIASLNKVLNDPGLDSNGLPSVADFMKQNTFGNTEITFTIHPETPFGSISSCQARARDKDIADLLAKNGMRAQDTDAKMLVFGKLANCSNFTGWGGITGGNVAYINGTPTFRSVAHELLGHTILGVGHASKEECPIPNDFTTGCWSKGANEYAGMFDLMGGSYNGEHFNAPHKIAGSNAIPTSAIQTVTNSGSYTLSPIDRPATSTETQVLIISKLDVRDDSYYVEYRKPFGALVNLFNLTRGTGSNRENEPTRQIATTSASGGVLDPAHNVIFDSRNQVRIEFTGFGPDQDHIYIRVTMP